ncbi:hypothetical protein [Sagittula sp. SSi028]|uniref:hypothetical protein n=1 Tax=Sagittula sp. SSi028 TaxID=3400636 RepID=UPI003AF7B39A
MAQHSEASMKVITVIQAGVLLLLAVFGAYASTTTTQPTVHCPQSMVETVCDL